MRSKGRGRITVLMADDDEDDCLLVKEAFEKIGQPVQLHFFPDGLGLMDYLRASKSQDALFPDLILLDLNMPRKDGRQALKEIKSDFHLRSIPIVIFTTSKDERDIALCYAMGASSFIPKPAEFSKLVAVLKALCDYWFGPVILPSRQECRHRSSAAKKASS